MIAVATRKGTTEGQLWREAEAILTAAAQAQSNPPTTTDPNAELRAQLLADGATTILGIVPGALFDKMCADHKLFRFDLPVWTSGTRLTVQASASRALAIIPMPQSAPRLLQRLARYITNRKSNGPSPSTLDYLWPARHDNHQTGRNAPETMPVRLFLKVPLGNGFDAQRRNLERHGRTIGLAAVADALTVNQQDARAVMERRLDPIGYVRCTRGDGTEMVAIIAQVGNFAPEQSVLDWVRRYVAAAAAA